MLSPRHIPSPRQAAPLSPSAAILCLHRHILHPTSLPHRQPPPPIFHSTQHVAAIVTAASHHASTHWFVVYTGPERHQQQQNQQRPSFETAGDFAVSLSPLSRHMPLACTVASAAAEKSDLCSGTDAARAIADYINGQQCRQAVLLHLLLLLPVRNIICCSILLDTSGHTDDAHWSVRTPFLCCFPIRLA
jgi:hypothetical protein